VRAVACLLALLALGATPSAGAAVAGSGAQAPVDPVTVFTPDGTAVALERLLSPRTLLVFMTGWCDACRAEQPEIEAWARENRGHTGTLLLVAGSEPAAVEALVDERRLAVAAHPVVADPEGQASRAYDVKGTPTLVLVDGRGEVLARARSLDQLPPPPSIVPIVDQGSELGTSYHVVVWVPPERADAARADLADARALCRAQDALLSEWREDSEISDLNRRAGGGWVELSATMDTLLAGALHVSTVTGGAFDPTWAPLGPLWEASAGRGEEPAVTELAATLEAVDWRHVELVDGRARFVHPGTRLGIAGVAKGWVVDSLVELLLSRGHGAVLVNVGGDLRVAGAPPAEAGETLEIADPFRAGEIAASVRANDTAVATSGNHRRGWTVGGRHVGHILDPRTGRPAPFDGTVTVLAPDAAMADALATALYVLGPVEGLAFARAHEGIEAIYVTREGVRSTLDGIVRR